MVLWADQVPGGNAVLLAPYFESWSLGSRAMRRQQQWVFHVEPEDFPERLKAFVEAAGLDLARAGPPPKGQCPYSLPLGGLFDLAAGMGLLHHLLPSVGGEEETVDSATVVDRD